jgi:hypothetical protein
MVTKIIIIIEKNESIYGHKILVCEIVKYGNNNNNNNRKNESIYRHKLLVHNNKNYGNKLIVIIEKTRAYIVTNY